jgi:DNA-binding transcriptional LysR family regulator
MLSITIRQLEYAVAVARAGGVTLAAERLNTSQPALSVALSTLEAQIGKPLFLRRPGGPIAVTSFGRGFLDEAERILSRLSRLTSDTPASAAPVALGCFEDLAPMILAPLIARSGAARPAIAIAPRICGFEELAADLAQGRIELAVSYDLGFDKSVVRQEIARLRPHALLAAGHPLAARPSLSLADLAGEPLVLTDQGLSIGHMRALFTRSGLDPDISRRVPTLEMMRSFAANGLGVGLTYTCPASDHSYDGRPLVTVPVRDAGADEPIVLARNAANPASATAAALAALLLEMNLLPQ